MRYLGVCRVPSFRPPVAVMVRKERKKAPVQPHVFFA
ncbi:hypothetical protein M7I_6000 [Glarea lozoyensis 74030]|uniref:Uncharacterized protein n=1 Tax=Glarea lozoyensis (strain ATCC 74030 / MF5533) TaxID=1104152 RepID=H0ETD8_GLAL7|nr:hypothetical protein M7I_6000 [Glarea lozoyensis 74030]